MTPETCSTCRYFVKYGQEPRGYCNFNPPAVFANGTIGVPEVKAERRACGQHQPIPEGGAPVVLGKAQPPTHGAVVAAAREAAKPAEPARPAGSIQSTLAKPGKRR